VGRIRGWSGLGKGKYYDWVKRYGKANGTRSAGELDEQIAVAPLSA